MTHPDAEIRHADLLRAERAAGEAFGWPEAAAAIRNPLHTPAALAAATAVVTVAATLSYFI